MHNIGVLGLALTGALLLGCGEKTAPTDADSKVAAAKDKIKDAAHATAEAAKARRDEYAGKISKQFDELDEKYDELKARADKAEGQAKQDLETKLAQAKVKRDAAFKKLNELKEATPDRWEKIKDGVEDALDDLKKAFE